METTATLKRKAFAARTDAAGSERPNFSASADTPICVPQKPALPDVPTYHPASNDPVTIPLGSWTAPPLPARTAQLVIDPRLMTWLVNQAARRVSLRYVVNQGTPPLTVILE